MTLVAGQLVKATGGTNLDTAGKITNPGALSAAGAITVPDNLQASINTALATVVTNMNTIITAYNALLTNTAAIGLM